MDTADTTAFTVDGLTGGTEYFFRVRAESDPAGLWSGNIEDGAITSTGGATATTADGVPDTPTLALGTVQTGEGANVPTHNSITLTWVALGTADGGSDITSYEILLWNSETSVWDDEATVAADEDKEEAATAPDNTYSYADEGLSSSTRYYYIARAVNSAGAGPWSDTLSGVTNPGNPDAPTLQAALEGTSAIKLSWNVPNNNGTAIAGYELQRRDSDDADWGTDSLLPPDGNNVTEFVDRGTDT